MASLDELRELAGRIEALAALSPADEAEARLIAAARAQAQVMLASALWRQGDFADAERAYDAALAASPRPAWEICRALMLPPVPASRHEILQAREAVRHRLQALLEKGPGPVDDPGEMAWTLFLLAYHAEEDSRPLHRLFRQVAEAACPALAWTVPHCQRPRRSGRLRVGFISWHLTDHTIARLFLRLAEEMDGDSFEISLFSFQGRHGAVGPMAGRRHIVLPADFFQARQVIAESELDLLIYLDLGMDYLTRFLAHNRLARKQAMLWGHPDSTGLPAMDYMLSPDCMEPEDGERHYDETLVRLPGTVALYDRPELPTQPKGRAQCGLPEDGMLFLCPQTPFKFHPDFDPALRAILEAVEGSHLVLLAGWEGEAMMRVRDRIAGRRPDLQQRIVILDALTRPDFLTLLSLADVLLDPFHYSGGNTSLEAFAFGAPIVTWPGKYMRARHTAGFYHLMGIEDLVARDQDHYVELAVALGKSPELRRRMRQRILGRCGMLYDDRRGLWALEAFISAIGMASL